MLEAADGLRGLKLLLAEPVDMVICDLEMPGLDGEKLLGVKRATPALAGVPFLFLTASTDVERRARLLEGGACDAMAKPFHPAELSARIRLHLKLKQLHDLRGQAEGPRSRRSGRRLGPASHGRPPQANRRRGR